jgi:hypothetical protein
MASEVLSVPEEHLADVIHVIRSGLAHVPDGQIADEVRGQLALWCREEEEYLERLEG